MDIVMNLVPSSRSRTCLMPFCSSLNIACFSGVSQMTTLPDSAVTTLSPLGVMTAWVTMAPSGASASWANSFPVLVSQRPQQLRVTVTARCLSRARLIESIGSSYRSILWTCSKILSMFQILTVLSMEEVITLFQDPTVRGSSWTILPKWASNTFISFVVSKLHT